MPKVVRSKFLSFRLYIVAITAWIFHFFTPVLYVAPSVFIAKFANYPIHPHEYGYEFQLNFFYNFNYYLNVDFRWHHLLLGMVWTSTNILFIVMSIFWITRKYYKIIWIIYVFSIIAIILLVPIRDSSCHYNYEYGYAFFIIVNSFMAILFLNKARNLGLFDVNVSKDFMLNEGSWDEAKESEDDPANDSR